MQSILKRRPSSTMAVAFLALFLAVSGTATAARLITGKQIARSTITGKHVRDHSLTAADFNGSLAGAAGPQGPEGPRGLTGAKGERGPQGDRGERGESGKDGKDGKDGRIGEPGKNGIDGEKGPQGDKGDTGPQGPKGDKGDTGPQGPKGDKGDTGPAGFNGVTRVSSVFSLARAADDVTGAVDCPAGAPRVVGGGVSVANSVFESRVLATYPTDTGWAVRMRNESGRPANGQTLVATVYAICVAG